MLAHGPISSKRILADAKDAGHSEKTLRRAKTQLGIKVKKTGMQGSWQWHLSTKVAKDTEAGQAKLPGTFEGIGHLRENEETETWLM